MKLDFIRYNPRKILGIVAITILVFVIILLSQSGGFDLELYLLEVTVALTVMIIGLLYWTFQPEIKKITESIKKSEKQHDAKKLNETVFRKLMRVKYYRDYKRNLRFEIPTDERALHPRTTNTYHMWTSDKISDRDGANNYISIHQAIPALKTGERYLQSNYKNIFKMWSNIKNTLDKHNENIQNFKNELGNQTSKRLKKELPSFKEVKKLGHNSRCDMYFIDEIQDFLFSVLFDKLEESKVDKLSRLKKWNSQGFFCLQSNGSTLIASFDENKIDDDKVRQIFREIVNNSEIVESFQKAIKIDSTFYDSIKKFSEKLEDDVVNEIDHLQSGSS
jgi:hypothetical protein